MDKNAELLLYAWGYWMRRSPGVEIGYPSKAIGADMIHTGKDLSEDKFWRRIKRKVLSDGKARVVQFMAPEPNPKQSRVASMKELPWPDEILHADRIIARMPFSYRQCLLAKYWLELTRREAIAKLQVGEWYYRRQLERAEQHFEEVLKFSQDVI